MAATYLSTWSPAVKVATRTALLELIDADAPTPGKITIHTAADVTLVTYPLAVPSFTIDGGTGAMTLAATTAVSGSADGTASYASLRDGSGDVLISLPCASGSSPVAGQCVLSDIAILSGRQVELVSFSIT